MPRTTRAVAQRLGTKQKSRRRASRQGPETPASVERILEEVAPATDDAPPGGGVQTAKPATGSLSRRGTAGTARGVGRAAPPRRRYADYATEYAYVWGDLRRIALVAGALLLLLIVLSFFIS